MLCGIDEAGRGALAGPLCIAGVILHSPVHGLNDSKLLSPAKREKLYDIIIANASWHAVLFSALEVDEKGLSRCLALGLEEIKATLNATRYLFDGNMTFGVKGLETLVKADALIPEVSAASIIAKVTRDRLMIALAQEFPLYDFDKHKGYGTKSHCEAIKTHGASSEHRLTFLKKIVQPSLF